MVTRSKTPKTGKEKKGRVKVGKLQLNKETVKNLSDSASKEVRGGKKRGDFCPPGTPPEESEILRTALDPKCVIVLKPFPR